VVALRGTASTGFRAPSLQQQYFTSTASVLTNERVIVETGTFPSVSAVAASLGGVALRPEKSFNLSAGAVLRAGGFDLTVDGYIIKVRDQLGLSENITLSSADQTLYGVRPPASSSTACTPPPRASTSSAITSCAPTPWARLT
jgi:iron complex outermembrane receptor protein